ncbi:hypothetical protein HYPSUDRAFT_41143 [Hypholoma sublateritium FD-334 SS-4]|uniref:Uncharacterized protein n=1 Tax=Hypholoma sublateritium (strain FD-334 SS-4) TaxID=945553 RepID=A0A0D2NTS4_HYPSF|nr:hypothetical protein HYPSUDRAFT_41143 [Hypholoma sublateritium FD-334 SS-4]
MGRAHTHTSLMTPWGRASLQCRRGVALREVAALNSMYGCARPPAHSRKRVRKWGEM